MNRPDMLATTADLLTMERAAQVVEELGVSLSASSLTKYAAAGRLPAIKPGRDWLTTRSALEWWLKTTPPKPDGMGRPRRRP